jgi:TRAP-type mannitol/chloroaromatic compound transport system permease small subunit
VMLTVNLAGPRWGNPGGMRLARSKSLLSLWRSEKEQRLRRFARLLPRLKEERMSQKNNLLSLIDKVNDKVGGFSSFVVPLLGFLILFEVIMRYGFNRPTIWVHDTSQFLFGAAYMLGAGYTLLLRGHVNMDMLYVRFSKRGKALADAATGVLVLVFLSVLVWQGGRMAWESVIFNEHLAQSVFEPPLYPIKIVFFLGCVLLLLQALAHWVRDVIVLLAKPEKTPNAETEG